MFTIVPPKWVATPLLVAAFDGNPTTKWLDETAQGSVEILKTGQQLQERRALTRIGYPAASHHRKSEMKHPSSI